jgi:hypothetical protein
MKPRTVGLGLFFGAGDENRTRALSLGIHGAQEQRTDLTRDYLGLRTVLELIGSTASDCGIPPWRAGLGLACEGADTKTVRAACAGMTRDVAFKTPGVVCSREGSRPCIQALRESRKNRTKNADLL